MGSEKLYFKAARIFLGSEKLYFRAARIHLAYFTIIKTEYPFLLGKNYSQGSAKKCAKERIFHLCIFKESCA